jgi:hypothetical protein
MYQLEYNLLEGDVTRAFFDAVFDQASDRSLLSSVGDGADGGAARSCGGAQRSPIEADSPCAGTCPSTVSPSAPSIAKSDGLRQQPARWPVGIFGRWWTGFMQHAQRECLPG